MLAVQPGSGSDGEEELTAVGVGTSVGHGEHSWLGVLQLEVLILELGAIDGFSAGAVVVGEVAALAHEPGDDSVERRVLEAEALLHGAQSAEILCGLGHYIGTQLHNDAAKSLSTSSHIEEDLGA